MPELPEVETVRRVLEPKVTGRTIREVRVHHPGVVAYPELALFRERVAGACIHGMGRRGKYLLLLLGERGRIVLHLRMTGQLYVTPPEQPLEKHTHLVFALDDGNELRYIDPRRFGRFWWLGDGEEDSRSGCHRLGPEPFGGEVTGTYLAQKCGKRRITVKECLLDQSVVAGIGNIYADETLHMVKIAPTRPACGLRAEEWARIAEAIPAVLDQAIDNNAMSDEEYFEKRGRQYRNEGRFAVYGREGKPCQRCGTILERIVIKGRSSCFCPRCQPQK